MYIYLSVCVSSVKNDLVLESCGDALVDVCASYCIFYYFIKVTFNWTDFVD